MSCTLAAGVRMIPNGKRDHNNIRKEELCIPNGLSRQATPAVRLP